MIPNTPTYQFIKELAELRKEIPTFRYGKVDVIFSDDLGPVPLIYKVYDESKTYIIMMNTLLIKIMQQIWILM